MKERQGSPWAEGEGRKKHPRGISLFVRAEIPSVAAKKRRPWHGTSLDCQPAFFPFLSRLTDSLCNSRNGGLLDPPPPPPPLFSRRLGIQLFQSRGNSRRWGTKAKRAREKKTFSSPFPLPSPAVSSSFHPSFSYTCILTCVRSLILCVFVRRPRSEGSNWRKRRRFVEKQAIRDPTTRENNTQASPTATFQSGYSTSQFRLLRSLQEAAYRRG